MNELDVLVRNFGLRPGGKSAPMRSDGGDHRSASARSSPFFDDHEGPVFNDVFGGLPKYTNSNTNNKASTMMNAFNYDSIFKSSNDSKHNTSKTSSWHDKSVYDEDIFFGARFSASKAQRRIPVLMEFFGKRPLSFVCWITTRKILLFYCGCRWSFRSTVDCTQRGITSNRRSLKRSTIDTNGISAGVPLTFVADAPTSLELLAKSRGATTIERNQLHYRRGGFPLGVP
nr:auxilin-related protein 2-like [Ipomoea batatas]